MQLYGTITSPFVRRVRVVAEEVGEPIELVDTATDAGQQQLRAVSPIRKVPVAVLDDGRTLFDSRAIIDWMLLTRGHGDLTPPRDRWRHGNVVNAIDAAVDGAIQLFYLRRDGVAVDGSVFATRHLERVAAILAWLEAQLGDGGRSFDGGFGVAEISLVAILDWMDFRSAYPTDRFGALQGVRTAWRDRPSLATTRPGP